MNILPEIHSLDDYENMSNYESVSDDPETMRSKNKVRFNDDFEEMAFGILYYNGHGLQLVSDDGTSANIAYDKFRYCTISNIDFNNFTVCVNDSWSLIFSNNDDFDNFYAYIDSFNIRTEYFLDAAIDKINKIYLENKNNSTISNSLDELLQVVPESFFIEDINYSIMVHHFTFVCDIVRKYVDYTRDETNTAYQVLRSNHEYSSAVTNIMRIMLKSKKIIESNVELLDEYRYFYLYLSLREKLIDKYSSIWEKEYDNTYDSKDIKIYLEYCANECYITQNDNRSIFSFACYWLQKTNNKTDDIRNVIKKIKSLDILKNCPTKKGTTTIKQLKSNLSKGNVEVNAISSYEKLNNLIGLSTIKNDVNNMINLVKMQIKRREQGLKTVPVSLHLVFTGNPGTGKTTIARILADIYRDIGILSKGQLVEVDRAGLVAGYVGQTAIKTQEKINEALGGILFIDEAYTLVKDGQDFGQEAIDTLLKAMEDNRDDFIVIVAGYTDLMQNFINSNPGLKSRFNKYIDFPDYSADELVEIFYSMCNEYQYTLTSNADKILREKLFDMEKNKDDNFANARDVRNLFEKVITNQATRLSYDTSENIMEIDSCDF